MKIGSTLCFVTTCRMLVVVLMVWIGSRTVSAAEYDSPNHLLGVSSLRNEYYCLRHGQSMANVEKKIASNPDIACQHYGLSNVGKQQAQQAGDDVLAEFWNRNNNNNNNKKKKEKRFKGILILSSDLLRARQTACAIRDAIVASNNHHLPKNAADEEEDNRTRSIIRLGSTNDIIIEERLRERNFGDFDLQSDDNYQVVWDDDQIDSSHTNHNVESVDAVMDRVTRCIREWDQRKINENDDNDEEDDEEDSCWMVICVAHGDILQILQTAFLKRKGSQHRSLEHLETATLRKLILSKQ